MSMAGEEFCALLLMPPPDHRHIEGALCAPCIAHHGRDL